jgi:hypothetical protein
MTDDQHKTVNQMYARGDVKKRGHSHDGQSKFSSQTTWGPSRRKKKRSAKQHEGQ